MEFRSSSSEDESMPRMLLTLRLSQSFEHRISSTKSHIVQPVPQKSANQLSQSMFLASDQGSNAEQSAVRKSLPPSLKQAQSREHSTGLDECIEPINEIRKSQQNPQFKDIFFINRNFFDSSNSDLSDQDLLQKEFETFNSDLQFSMSQ